MTRDFRSADDFTDRSVAVIRVTYNSRNEIDDFVASVARQRMKVTLWLVDNASTDGTPTVLKNLQRSYRWIKVILNLENVGLAAANNQPIPQLRENYVAIVNPDVVLHDRALEILVSSLESAPDIVASAPVNEDSDGIPHSSFHRRWTLIHLFAWRMIPSVIMRNLYKYIRKYRAQNVLFASGACLMMRRRDFVAIGGYDPKYFLTIEDTCDLCIRLCRKIGDRVVIEPKARITHFISRSAAAVPFVTTWNGARGSIYHFKKHYGPAAGLAAYFIVFLSTAVRIVAALPMAIIFQGARTRLRNGCRVLTFLVKDNPLRI